MILNVPIEEGNSVIEANNFNDGTTIASVADMEDLIFRGNIDESEVEKLKNGMMLIVTIGAIEGRKFEAELEYISPKGVDINGAIQFEVRAAIKLEAGEFIRAGYSANADVVLERRDQVLSISERVIQFDDEENTYIEVKVGDNKYERKDVELGLSDGITVEILSGITEEDEAKIWNQPIKAED
jgi:HlyD family secretion protein